MEFSWFALACNVYTHPKTLRLAEALHMSVNETVGALGRLWAWAVQSSNEDGVIGFLPERELADIMRWRKKPAILLQALLDCGFLEQTAQGKCLHDWAELNGKFQTKKRTERERKARATATETARKTSALSVPTEPNQTKPYHTTPHQDDTAVGDCQAVQNSVSGDMHAPAKASQRKARGAHGAQTHPPTQQEIDAYAVQRQSHVLPQAFFEYYQARGWQLNGQPMRDWQACFRLWEQRGNKNTADTTAPQAQMDAWDATWRAQVAARKGAEQRQTDAK